MFGSRVGVRDASSRRRADPSTCHGRPPWSLFRPMADELDGMTTFVAVAEAKGFRAASDRLGVTHSAVSQTIRRLEERLDVALVRRSTRSVHLTEAGEQLYAA